ncbi:MAG: hypothetical protein A3F74_04945 [Betaproteobacteria bacterium RIFCSPLOWO2_12_FULL_62_58]|nr:MAG: hypothetical protein A3F74_04945 [Betaproteobacteria bacterium RIFCSPLOWO2_12_FULL_62_58]
MIHNTRLDAAARLIARVSAIAMGLVFVVIIASAYLRLTQAGLGCADWPACYGAATAAADPLASLVRGTHRIAASAVGFLVVLIAVVCWSLGRQWPAQALVAALLAVLTVLLALLGRATTGTHLPAVTLGNLLGGMTMLALLCWLRLQVTMTATVPKADRMITMSAGLGLVLLVAQISLGGLVSAHYALTSCTTFPDCNGAWWPRDWSLAGLDPWREASPPSTTALAPDPGRQALHMAHRFGAAGVAVYLIGLAIVLLRRKERMAVWSRRLIAAIAVQLALGITALHLQPPLFAVLAHNATAALLLLVLVAVIFQSRSAEVASVSA